jgi:hypothetical protein
MSSNGENTGKYEGLNNGVALVPAPAATAPPAPAPSIGQQRPRSNINNNNNNNNNNLQQGRVTIRRGEEGQAIVVNGQRGMNGTNNGLGMNDNNNGLGMNDNNNGLGQRQNALTAAAKGALEIAKIGVKGVAEQAERVNWPGLARVSGKATAGVIGTFADYIVTKVQGGLQSAKGSVRNLYCRLVKKEDYSIKTVLDVLGAFQEDTFKVYYKPRKQISEAVKSTKLNEIEKARIQSYINSGTDVANLFIQWILAVAARERIQSMRSSLTTSAAPEKRVLEELDNRIFELYDLYNQLSQLRANELTRIIILLTEKGVKNVTINNNGYTSNIGFTITPTGKSEDMSYKGGLQEAIRKAALTTMYGILIDTSPARERFIRNTYGIVITRGQHVDTGLQYTKEFTSTPSFDSFVSLIRQKLEGKSIETQLREIAPTIVQIVEPALSNAAGSCPLPSFSSGTREPAYLPLSSGFPLLPSSQQSNDNLFTESGKKTTELSEAKYRYVTRGGHANQLEILRSAAGESSWTSHSLTPREINHLLGSNLGIQMGLRLPNSNSNSSYNSQFSGKKPRSRAKGGSRKKRNVLRKKSSKKTRKH